MIEEDYVPCWDWLATRISSDLIPIAKALVACQVQSALRGQSLPNTEEDLLKQLCQNFEVSLDDILPLQSDRDRHLINIVYDHLRFPDLLKAIAMVESGLWKEIPEIYRDARGFENLQQFKVINNNNFLTNRKVKDFALTLGRAVWGSGPYDAAKDPFRKEYR